MTDMTVPALEAAYRAAVTALVAVHASGAPRSTLKPMADTAYSIAIAWSVAADKDLVAKGWSNDDARKMSARADSAIWDALSLGGGGGR